MNSYYITTASSTVNDWWYRSPYFSHSYYQPFQPFNVYMPTKKRTVCVPKEEMQQMSDEEFDAAFKDLLFGSSKQEGENA